jgi:hypothetical protein
VFDNISLLWSLQLLPLWHQPPKRKTLKTYRTKIRLALIKDLSMIPIEAVKIITLPDRDLLLRKKHMKNRGARHDLIRLTSLMHR